MACRTIFASAEAVRRVWLNSELTLKQAAVSLDMSEDALRDRAIALGLPQRRMGRREVIRPEMEADFTALWNSGVSAREIGEHFGCSYFAVVNTASRLDLCKRGVAYRPRLTLAAWREARLGDVMAARVRAETARLKKLKGRLS